ncbi:hydrolase [Gardnerella sp. DNF00172]
MLSALLLARVIEYNNKVLIKYYYCYAGVLKLAKDWANAKDWQENYLMTLNDEHSESPKSFTPIKVRRRPTSSKSAAPAEGAAPAKSAAPAKNDVSAKNDAPVKEVSDEYLSSDLPETELSIADFSRKHANPKRWWIYLGILLLAIVLPYWVGRTLAVQYTSWVVSHCAGLSAQGVVFISWVITVAAFTSLAMALIESSSWVWRFIFVVFLAFEQLIAGLCMLSMSFWYSTYVVYGPASGLANAANLGIISAGFAVAVFAVLFVGLLVIIPKKSRLNVLTRSWASFIMFYAVEVLAIIVVIFGGFMTAM